MNLPMSESHCIFRVPSILKGQNEEAYIPKIVSTGPFHCHREELKVAEKMKLKYARDIADRGTGDKLQDFFAVIKEVENETRASYGGSTDHVGDFELFKIMVLDGLFIIELLRKLDDEKVKDEDDPIFNNYCMVYLCHDLILLENQIPWLVLKRLFNTTKKAGEKPLTQLALNFFSRIFPSTPPVLTLPQREPDHILDLLRDWFVSSSREVEPVKPWQTIPSASQLSYAGIKFRRSKSNSLNDITFINGVLRIPHLLIAETTQVAILNLIRYEQLTLKCTPKIASYTKFLGDLIITVADLDILSKNDIIATFVSPEDATRFFEQLRQDVYSQVYCYVDLCEKINDYFKRKRAKRRAMFIRNYFSTPLAVACQNLPPDLSDLDDCTDCTF